MVEVACVSVLVVVFAWSSAAKMTPDGFSALLSMLSPLGKTAKPLGILSVCAEVGVVLGLLVPPTRPVGIVLATVVSAVLAGGVAYLLNSGREVRCACFGRRSVVLDSSHLVRNLVLLAVSVTAWAVPATEVGFGGFALASAFGVLVAVVLARVEDVAYLVRT